MTDAKAKIILLTGSPLPSTLSWSESALSSALLACFNEQGVARSDGSPRPTVEDVMPQWRHLPLERQHLPTGLTQASYAELLNEDRDLDDENGNSLTPTALDTEHPATQHSKIGEDLSHFYAHSFAIHEDTDLRSPRDLKSNESSLNTTFDNSLEESGMHSADNDSYHALVKARLAKSVLSDLSEMPSARHLRSVAPQTVTVDMVVGVIAVSQPKAILTRRGHHVELVELVVGDETSAGFAINIWLDAQRNDGREPLVEVPLDNNLRSQILRLRPRDIIFARNVALGSFRNTVSGQSLRRGVTSIDLLYRTVVDSSDQRGVFRSRKIEEEFSSNAKMAKVKRTKEWVANFVGETRRPRRGPQNVEKSMASLPEDTQ